MLSGCLAEDYGFVRLKREDNCCFALWGDQFIYTRHGIQFSFGHLVQNSVVYGILESLDLPGHECIACCPLCLARIRDVFHDYFIDYALSNFWVRKPPLYGAESTGAVSFWISSMGCFATSMRARWLSRELKSRQIFDQWFSCKRYIALILRLPRTNYS